LYRKTLAYNNPQQWGLRIETAKTVFPLPASPIITILSNGDCYIEIKQHIFGNIKLI